MNIAIVGDACTDIYVYGACDRLCPEGPVPVLNKMHQIETGGMALNVFNNLQTFFRNNVAVRHYRMFIKCTIKGKTFRKMFFLWEWLRLHKPT